MYHAIVKSKLRKAFSDLSAGNYETVLAGMAPSFEHTFFGNHPLGGTRHTPGTYRLWFERLRRLFPDLRFTINSIIVRGWPWDTLAVVEWRDDLTTRDGTAYHNFGVHILRMRWTKVVELRIYCDNQKLAEICAHQARNGVADATAAQITD